MNTTFAKIRNHMIVNRSGNTMNTTWDAIWKFTRHSHTNGFKIVIKVI